MGNGDDHPCLWLMRLEGEGCCFGVVPNVEQVWLVVGVEANPVVI